LLGGVFLLNTVVLLLVMQLPYTSSDRSRVEEYYLPAYFAAAVVIGAGLGRAVRPLGGDGRRMGTALAWLICLVAPAVPLLQHWGDNDMSRNHLAYDYSMAALTGLDEDAVYFAAPDFSSFPAVYLQSVEGVRPDVILADVTGRLSERALRYLAEVAPEFGPVDKNIARDLMVVRGWRPVYTCPLAGSIDLRRFRLDPWGLAVRVQWRRRPAPEGAPRDGPDPFAERAVRNIPLDVPAGDLEQALAACYYMTWAEQSMSRGAFADAVPKYEMAGELLAGYGSYLNTLGAFCGRRHAHKLEEAFYRKALAVAPGNRPALMNLGMLMEMQARFADAREVYGQLLALAPSDPWANARAAVVARRLAQGPPPTVHERIEALVNEWPTEGGEAARLKELGDLRVLAGDLTGALDAFEQARRADPEYAPVYRSLAVFYEQVVQDRRKAEEYAGKAQELTPTAKPSS